MDRANQTSREADIAALAGLARLGFFSWDDAYACVLVESGVETTNTAIGGDQALAPLGAIDRAEDSGGQG